MLQAGAAGPVAASAVLTSFHNLVTASINAKFVTPRKRFFCIGDVLAQLPASFKVGANEATVLAAAQSTHAALPGLVQQHRIVNCPSAPTTAPAVAR
mmetsp:Transcript_48227/g.153976  ORF Transcript_48227/g.153976 Transcript_48227/m.153976 type:complete len:97 (+) Transcript_48227:1025-1315(+)